MRVSSLSDERIIRKVSDYFIPVYLSRDNYQSGSRSKEDVAALARIDASRFKLKTPGGAVCVYIATSSGEVVDTLIVHKACQPQLLAPFLDRFIAAYKLQARKPELVKSAQPHTVAASIPKPKTARGRMFVVRTRFDDPGPNRGISRDTIELTAYEWGVLVQAGKAERGKHTTIRETVAKKLLQYAYPPLPHWKSKLARLKKSHLTARVESVDAQGARLSLEGEVELVYPDQGKPTDGTVTATLAGTALVDVRSGKLQSFTLVSREGKYLWHWNGKPQPKRMSLSIELAP